MLKQVKTKMRHGPGARRIHRWAEKIHRIELIDEKPGWTLFFYGRKERDWRAHPGLRTQQIIMAAKKQAAPNLSGTLFPRLTPSGYNAVEEIQRKW